MLNAHGDPVPEGTPVSLKAQIDPTRLAFYVGQGLAPSPVQATQKLSEVHPDAHAFFHRTEDPNAPSTSDSPVIPIAIKRAGEPTRPGLGGEASSGAVGAVDPAGAPQTPAGFAPVATVPSAAADAPMMRGTNVLREQPVAAPMDPTVTAGVTGGPPAAGTEAPADLAFVAPPASAGDPNTVVGAPGVPIEPKMTPPGASALSPSTREDQGPEAFGASGAPEFYENPLAPPAAAFAAPQNALQQTMTRSMAAPANGVVSASGVRGVLA